VIENEDSLTDEQIKTLNDEYPVMYGDIVLLRKRVMRIEKQIDRLINHREHDGVKNDLMSKLKEYRGYIITTGIVIITLSSWLIQFVINK
jgi:hypothetical protein